ncbi:hypothetical protein TCAL_16984 [Tigriopus californicus]|uniref:Uncharacterized protein n=1 Tax=Tigriopus californicus TaxID=6832 RepID=A0A553PIG7_TIGCA|nr:hypothetical protein TCAL_16984 [Tigriopus californicus]
MAYFSLNHRERERNVYNHKHKEEHQHIQDHVGDADDDRTRLSPHETTLDGPQEAQNRSEAPNGGCHKGDLVALVRTTRSALVAEMSHRSQDERHKEHDVRGQDVQVPEGAPSFEDPLTITGSPEPIIPLDVVFGDQGQQHDQKEQTFGDLAVNESIHGDLALLEKPVQDLDPSSTLAKHWYTVNNRKEDKHHHLKQNMDGLRKAALLGPKYIVTGHITGLESVSLAPFLMQELLELLMSHEFFVPVQNGNVKIGVRVTAIGTRLQKGLHLVFGGTPIQ